MNMSTSKILLLFVMLTYFFAVVFGAVCCWFKAPEQLYAYFGFIGTPTTAAIGFYTWKAKCENIHKNPDVINDTELDTVEKFDMSDDINDSGIE